MQSVHTAAMALMTALLAWHVSQASAETQPVAPPAGVATAAAVTPAVPSKAGGDLFGSTAKAVSTEALEGLRGGAETVNEMRLHGTVADNSATNVRTGSNYIGEGSFANAAGIPTAIQNTGANVLIQNATIINVQFKP